MSRGDALTLYAVCLAAMLACRCVPIFLLKGHELSGRLSSALGLIPAAAFSALVANDLFRPEAFAQGPWPAAVPLVAAGVVVLVGVRTRSLVWCALAGVGCYALLLCL